MLGNDPVRDKVAKQRSVDFLATAWQRECPRIQSQNSLRCVVTLNHSTRSANLNSNGYVEWSSRCDCKQQE